MLTVSKHWHEVILGSTELQRKLFLEPVQKREHLDSAFDESKSEHEESTKKQPTITQELSTSGKLIIELHPILMQVPHDIRGSLFYIHLRSLDVLSIVPALTLLSQPPLKDLSIECCFHEERLSCTKGITFGELSELCRSLQDSVQKLFKEHVRRCHLPGGDDITAFISINISGAILAEEKDVKIARGTQAQLQSHA
ncbi:hypothetical protein E2P81_ATG10479 [Venturia nashicola]|nr:hypothetical protein E2P81_ATG10479 [Venturia nashicola]